LSAGELTHLDEHGKARMVDVGQKSVTQRCAVARARVVMKPDTFDLITQDSLPKGDVFGAARIAGIMAAKKTADLIPLCHPLELTGVVVDIESGQDGCSLEISVAVRTRSRTGVEMEALTGASVAALTVYDMCKAVDREMSIQDVRLVAKSGGRSGVFLREGEAVDRSR